ncbi:hypothetical protein [Sulfurimonas sp.]|uniref:hypothetical protein n=1 Tax=Sulfurimonas sp. TaxID=2022749 RepID=UPI0035667D35
MSDLTITIIVIIIGTLTVIASIYFAYNSIVKRIDNSINSQNEKLLQSYNSLQVKLEEDISLLKNIFEKNSDSTTNDIKNIESSLLNKHKEFNKSIDTIKANLGTYTTNIQRQINHARLDNIISFSNEISKYKNGIEEDEYFLKEVNECKIYRMTDKTTNEVTNIYYKDGLKSYTETFLEHKLIHKLYYSAENVLEKGEDYGNNGELLVDYQYDEAGEISQKTEYEYDNESNIINKIEMKY